MDWDFVHPTSQQILVPNPYFKPDESVDRSLGMNKRIFLSTKVHIQSIKYISHMLRLVTDSVLLWFEEEERHQIDRCKPLTTWTEGLLRTWYNISKLGKCSRVSACSQISVYMDFFIFKFTNLILMHLFDTNLDITCLQKNLYNFVLQFLWDLPCIQMFYCSTVNSWNVMVSISL